MWLRLMASRRAPSTIGVDVVADSQRLLEDGFVCADSLHGKNAAGDFGDGVVAVRRDEPTGVADLAAGVAIEAGVVENDFDLIAGRGGRHADAVFHDGEHFGVGGVELLVAEEVGLLEFAIGGAGGLLAAAFPTGAGAGLLFGAGGLKAGFVELDAGIATIVSNQIFTKTECFIEEERLRPFKNGDATFPFFEIQR